MTHHPSLQAELNRYSSRACYRPKWLERGRVEIRFARVQSRDNVDLQLQVVFRDQRQRRLFCELTDVVRRSSGGDANLIADLVDSKISQSSPGSSVDPGFKQPRACQI